MTKPAFEQNKEFQEMLQKEFNNFEKTDADRLGSKAGTAIKESVVEFNLVPEELESYLNKYIIGQREAIEVIATKVCTHFNRMKLESTIADDEKLVGNIKSNMLLIGPTGVGKTYIIKLIAKKIGVPFVKADATKFSETGYVGGDVEDLVRELVHEAEGDISKAEYGIIYLDEIDKIASSGSFHGPDVSRTGVQRNLLKLMEESEVDLKTPHDLASQMEAAMEAQRTGTVKRKKINTRNILFIVSGAFNSLENIIKKRNNMTAIGFDKAAKTDGGRQGLLKLARTEDLIEFGFESEFIGRLPVTVVLNDLDEDGLYQILKNKYSTVVLGKKLDFRSYGIALDFTDGALRLLASRAYAEKTGARGLLSSFERVLIKFEKTLPSTDIKKLVIDESVLADPDAVLREMLLADSIKGFQKDFFVKNGIVLEFDHAAAEKLHRMSMQRHMSIKQLCSDLFHDYPYGIRLMKLENFQITESAVDDPDGYLDAAIRLKYNQSQG